MGDGIAALQWVNWRYRMHVLLPQTLRSRSKKTGGRGVPGAMRSECSCAVPAAARYRYSAVDARVAASPSTGYPHLQHLER